MRITWVMFDGLSRDANGHLTSRYASARLRVLIPGRELSTRKHHVRFTPVVREELPGPAVQACLTADVVIFPKAFLGVYAQLAELARGAGSRVVFDTCDNQFAPDHPYSANARALAACADLVTCNTQAMANVARTHTPAPCVVIQDPYENDAIPPRFAPEPAHLKVLWYGHESHAANLRAAIPELAGAARACPLALTVLSRPDCGMEAVCDAIAAAAPGRITARFEPWTPEGQQAALDATDLVIVTTRPTPLTDVKSPNRLVSALRAGRMVVAYPLPSYKAYARWAWLGDSLAGGITWTLAHRERIPGRIRGAQKALDTRHAPAAVGKQWELTLRKLLAGKLRSA